MSANVNQFINMFKKQMEMNSVVNPKWLSAGYDWQRAIMMEAAEAVGHCGWKWWKKEVPDMAQLHIELVDIWHFLMSHALEVNQHLTSEQVAQLMLIDLEDSQKRIDEYGDSRAESPLLQSLEWLISKSASKVADIDDLNACMRDADLSWADMYAMYMGKNCLNLFRQAHGYKQGTYLKDWSARELMHTPTPDRALEDNDHLYDIMRGLNMDDLDLFEKLTREMANRYAAVVAASAAPTRAN